MGVGGAAFGAAVGAAFGDNMSRCELKRCLVAGAASLQVTSDGKSKVWTETTRLYLVYGQCYLNMKCLSCLSRRIHAGHRQAVHRGLWQA